MARLRVMLSDPRQRRQWLTVAGGTLIAAALLAEHVLGLPVWGAGLMIAAALVSGADIAVRAWKSLRNRHASIELLVTIAATGAVFIGEYWEAAAVTFLFMLGAYLEARTLGRTRKVLQDLLDLAPATAIVVRAGRQVEVPPHEVTTGETVLVKPGGRVPVDGEVLGGHSAVDESSITGESMPEDKGPGSRVYAGTVNQHGLLQVRAEGVGADTTLARIVRRVEEAQDAKAPTQRFIERFARWYTPGIIALSALAFLVTRDLELALTLLVIGCPGALVISTPVSVVAGIGRAAQHGILIKGGEYLENAGRISVLALDKTGTLTRGKPRVTDVVALPVPVAAGAQFDDYRHPLSAASGRWDAGQAEVLGWAAIAESGSEHPLARAVMAEMDGSEPVPAGDEFTPYVGRGVRAGYRGRSIVVGTADLMSELGIPPGVEASRAQGRLKSAGKTAVLVALDGAVIGVLGIADTLRESAQAMVRGLKASGVRPVMLTGDDRLTARAIAAEAGIDEVQAELLPDDKLEAVRRLQAAGQVVAMVGDGVNDAPALAAADLGVAMGAAGSGLAVETADIALMTDDLMKIPAAIRFSKATLRNIHQNVVIALVTVAALLAGVLLGEVNMAGGMLIHEASVLIVILNGMRLLRA